jgi:hypothetical protein
MVTIDAKIIKFLKRHHVLTLATVDSEGNPYCAALFYAYDSTSNRIVFSSDPATSHARHLLVRSRVAASIPLETRIIGRIQGLQLCGTVVESTATDRTAYLVRFPYAAVAELHLWTLVPDLLKYTDNTLGFGKKLIWQADTNK